MKIVLSGKYEIILSPLIIEEMRDQRTVTMLWHSKNTDKTNNPNNELSRDLVRCLYRKITAEGEDLTHITGYTRAIVTSLTSQEKNIFYSHPCYQGEEWYDWAMVHYEETNQAGDHIETYYPSKLLGFIQTNGIREAVIRCSVNPLSWDDIQQNFTIYFQLGKNFDVLFTIVPIESIVHPLCIIRDDGEDLNRYFVVLPKRNWSRYFGYHIHQ